VNLTRVDGWHMDTVRCAYPIQSLIPNGAPGKEQIVKLRIGCKIPWNLKYHPKWCFGLHDPSSYGHTPDWGQWDLSILYRAGVHPPKDPINPCLEFEVVMYCNLKASVVLFYINEDCVSRGGYCITRWSTITCWSTAYPFVSFQSFSPGYPRPSATFELLYDTH
jgi:hypothetical protein